MDKKKLKAYILISIFMGIFFFVVLGILVYSVIKQINFAVYMSVIGLPTLSFLTALFITQAVKMKNDIDKKEQDNNGKIER